MNESIIIGSHQPTRRRRGGSFTLILSLLAAGAAAWYLLAPATNPPAPLPILPAAATTTPAAPLVSSVQLAFLDGSGKAKGKAVGCDKLALVELEVTPTADPLSASLASLFSGATTTKLVPGNYVAERQAELRFDHAALEGTTAQVYLVGTTTPLGGECDDPRLQGQVEETALANSEAKKVKIFVNGEPYAAPSLKGD